MKKREQSAKASRSKPALHKKNTHKHKSKPKASKEQPETYIVLGNSFYAAATHTERHNYQQFQQRVKTSQLQLKKSRPRTLHAYPEPNNLRDYVRTLSRSEKQQLMRDLSKDMREERGQLSGRGLEMDSREELVEQENNLTRLHNRLAELRLEIKERWSEQVQKVNQLFESEQISLEEMNSRASLVERIKQRKLTMLDYINVLFEKILMEEGEIEWNKQQHIEQIVSTLQSSSNIQDIPEPPPNDHTDAIEELEQIMNPAPSQTPLHFNHAQPAQQQQQLQIVAIEQQPSPKKEQIYIPFPTPKLRLDIRIDQVQFGKDTYEDSPNKPALLKVEGQSEVSSSKAIEKLQSELISPLSPNKQPSQEKQDFVCNQSNNEMQIAIPPLMTRDRVEQLQIEKATSEKQALTEAIKRRTARQLSEVGEPNEQHFSTLMGVNKFVMTFYELVMHQSMQQVIQGMNIPYGKSCLDKLYLLKHQGHVPDFDYNKVLPEQSLTKYHQQTALLLLSI